VTAEDPAGHKTSTSRKVKILSEYKVGNFDLPFEDLKVEMGGMPITITRRYNAENANYIGDFGYGWDLEYAPVSLEASIKGNPRGSWSILDPDASLQDGTRILVKLPDGSTAGYTVKFSPYGWFGDQYTISLVADAGVTASLEIVGPTRLFRNDGSGYMTSSGYYHPASTWYNDSFKLSYKGMTYTIDATTGLATSAANFKGERIEISKSGFTSYNSQGQIIGKVVFERDSQNRIT
jgi:hypothetical protein